MSNPEEADTCVSDTQETYYEGANESFKIISETQNASLNESQDFNLVVSEGDDSMVERKRKQDEEKSTQQTDPPQISAAPRTADNNAITTKDKEAETIVDEKEKAIEETEGNVSSELCESEKKDDLFDEDEVIQGTPPESYSPSRKIGSVDVASLKRKTKSIDEPPTKILRTTSADDVKSIKRQLEEEEESRQSCNSDDSYQDLFKNIDKNVIIEETQDPTTLEVTQNSLKFPTEHPMETTNEDKTQKRTEQTNQQRDEASSEKRLDVKKDENLKVSVKPIDSHSANDNTVALRDYNGDSPVEDNLSVETKGDTIVNENLNASAKLNDTNDSTVVNVNFNGSDSQLEKNLSVEMEEGVAMSTVIADENLDTSTKLSDNDSAVNVNSNGDHSQPRDDQSIETARVSTSITTSNKTSGFGTLDEMESLKDTESISEKNNETEQLNCVKSTEKIVDDNDEELPSSQTKSRTSVECIYERSNRASSDSDSRSKPQVVQIDDDGEKILDSSAEVVYDGQSAKTKGRPSVVQIDDSHEDLLKKSAEIQIMEKSSYESKSSSYDFSYKSIESTKETSLSSKLTDKLVNGSSESKKSDGDVTLSLDSDTFSTDEIIAVHDAKKIAIKDVDNIDHISISDHETSNMEEKNKSELNYNSLVKTVQVEREIGVYLKLKCLLHVDENTKEPMSKELTAVHCEPIIIESRPKNEDSGSFADISDKESPGSINSNIQPYQLPSRMSIMSSISSSSSASSAASLQSRLARNAGFFPPLGMAKHAKKSSQDVPLSADKLNETYDRLTREWKNHRLLTTTVLNYANVELGNTTIGTVAVDVENVNNERLDDHLVKTNMRSSTPSDQPIISSKMDVTPKGTKKGKTLKRSRSKLTRSNGENGADNIPDKSTPHTDSRKKNKIDSTLDISKGSLIELYPNSMPLSSLSSDLIGKNVFAKWSDKNYYPGTVSSQSKDKYKVDFYDGETKLLIPEFVIPIPKTLREGLSVYATTKTDDYRSCGIIVDVQTSDVHDTYYMVETDEGEQLRVQLSDISLSADQAQVLKEEMDSADKNSLPSTPKALGQVTLDNVVDGKRRSKRLGTPLCSTPKSRSAATAIAGTNTSIIITKSEPSVSGISTKLKKEKSALSENDGISSDSNVEPIQDEYALRGVQREIIGTPYDQINAKGPQNRIKSKPRSKKKLEDDPQMIQDLGPIPNSKIFKGMSFIFTCATVKTLDRFLSAKSAASSADEATETDCETENEEEWDGTPFVRDRLYKQIEEGGGKIYLPNIDDVKEFSQIPKNEYKNITLVTNVPNTTAKNILCLSAGIPVCNHKWIIRCCTEGKIVNAAEHALPNGWSLQKKVYIEAFQTQSRKKPLSEMVVIIPSVAFEKEYVTFWRQVCENAGAVVLIAEDSGAMETMDFDSDNAVVLSNRKCPSWALKRATELRIPILATTWVVQCIIEGKLCPRDQHPRYRYNYTPN